MHFIAFLMALVLLPGCARVYTSGTFENALQQHKTVAILPAQVNMQLRPNEQRRLGTETLAGLAQRTGYDIQERMYGWLLRRSERFEYTVTFQDVSRTNALLKQAGITYEDLAGTDRAKLASLLGVDAVIQDKSVMDKPMSDGAAIAVGLVVGVWGPTNRVASNVQIHDGKTGDLLWKMDVQSNGSVGSSSDQLVNHLMRRMARRFPYSTRK